MKEFRIRSHSQCLCASHCSPTAVPRVPQARYRGALKSPATNMHCLANTFKHSRTIKKKKKKFFSRMQWKMESEEWTCRGSSTSCEVQQTGFGYCVFPWHPVPVIGRSCAVRVRPRSKSWTFWRRWRYLHPVNSLCEPHQSADPHRASFLAFTYSHN